MKLTILSASKESNYYKHVEKTRMVLESSRKLANRLLGTGNTRHFRKSIIVSVDNKFRKTYLLWKRGQSISTETVVQFTEEHVNKRFQAHRFLYCENVFWVLAWDWRILVNFIPPLCMLWLGMKYWYPPSHVKTLNTFWLPWFIS